MFVNRISHVCLSCCQSALADKTDIAHLRNSDRVTGQIKEMLLGELRVDTKDTGYVTIKWNCVASIDCDKQIQFETTDGTRYLGPVTATAERDSLSVGTGTGTVGLGHSNVIYFEPVSFIEHFWDRLDNRLRRGFSYSEGSDLMRWNIAAGLDYKTAKSVADLSFESFVTNDSDGNDSRRTGLTASCVRLHKNLTFLIWNR